MHLLREAAGVPGEGVSHRHLSGCDGCVVLVGNFELRRFKEEDEELEEVMMTDEYMNTLKLYEGMKTYERGVSEARLEGV